MKKLLPVVSAVICLLACAVFSVAVFAEEFTEADKRIFGVFPIWLFILIMAGAIMLAIIIIVEIAKRNQK